MSSPLSPALSWQLANAKWAASLNPLISNPLNNISIIPFNLQPGTNIINHMLGRTQQGWLLTDIQSGVIAARYYISVGSLAVTANTSINFDTSSFDSNDSVITGTGWRFVAPEAGFYQVSFTGNGSPTGQVHLYVNGVMYSYLTTMTASAMVQAGSDTVELNANDYIDIRPDTNSTFSGGQITHVEITSFPPSIYRNAPFNASTLSLYSSMATSVLIGVY
jgi:hypothetical protein